MLDQFSVCLSLEKVPLTHHLGERKSKLINLGLGYMNFSLHLDLVAGLCLKDIIYAFIQAIYLNLKAVYLSSEIFHLRQSLFFGRIQDGPFGDLDRRLRVVMIS